MLLIDFRIVVSTTTSMELISLSVHCYKNIQLNITSPSSASELVLP